MGTAMVGMPRALRLATMPLKSLAPVKKPGTNTAAFRWVVEVDVVTKHDAGVKRTIDKHEALSNANNGFMTIVGLDEPPKRDRNFIALVCAGHDIHYKVDCAS